MEPEVVILPEMELAGTEALRESHRIGHSDEETAVAVYMAMRAVYLISILPKNSLYVH